LLAVVEPALDAFHVRGEQLRSATMIQYQRGGFSRGVAAQAQYRVGHHHRAVLALLTMDKHLGIGILQGLRGEYRRRRPPPVILPVPEVT
jgi:hypothetical protein